MIVLAGFVTSVPSLGLIAAAVYNFRYKKSLSEGPNFGLSNAESTTDS